jgi:hypothetical protein
MDDTFDPHQLHKLPFVFPEPMSTPMIDSDFVQILQWAPTGEKDELVSTIRDLVAECRRLIVKEKFATREFSDELAENIRLRKIIEAAKGVDA